MADTLRVKGRLATSPMPFGPFLLHRRLGAGGMAETYLAERRARTLETGDVLTPFGRSVCLKLILPQHLDDPTFRGWFFDEARIHAHLHHDNIVQVYDFGELEGRAYLVLEYVEGCDLRVLMNELHAEARLLPTRLVVAIAHELAAALDCAHRLTIAGEAQSLVHRDVSPHNVLLSTHGHAKLCDFGVVKAHSRVMRTETGGIKGKIPYMSPEQLSAPSTIDGRTDLFALGVVLFELLTGSHPFRTTGAETDMEVARRIIEGTRARVIQLAPSTPAGLAAVVEELLQTDVNRRVPSAERLMWLLEAQADAPTAATARELAGYIEATRGDSVPAIALGMPGGRSTDGAQESRPFARSERAAARESRAAQSRVRTRSQGRSWLRPGRTALGVLALALVVALGTGIGAAILARKPQILDRRADAWRRAPPAQTARSTRPPALPSPKAEDVPADAPAALGPGVVLHSPNAELAENHTLTATAGRSRKRSRHTAMAARASMLDQPEYGDSRLIDKQPLDSWLDISVEPDGQTWRVWVDGQYQGTADVKVKVSAGKHLVAVGLEQPSRQRVVRAAADAPRTLSFKSP